MEINKTQLGFADGWRVIYQARTVFAILLLIAVLANLAIFFVSKFTTLVKDVPPIACKFPCFTPPCAIAAEPFKPSIVPPKTTSTTTAPADGPIMTAAPARPETLPPPPSRMATPEEVNKSLKWYAIFSNVMNLTGIVSLVSILFMVFTALAGIMMIIAGRLPGAGQVTSAFFWSIGIVALLLPWPNFIPQAACLPIGIAEFNSLHASLTQLACSGGSCPLSENIASIVQVWVRFVLFPVIILLIDIMYLARTRQAAIQIRALALAAETRTSV